MIMIRAINKFVFLQAMCSASQPTVLPKHADASAGPVFAASGGKLLMNGKRLLLKGVSWFGFEGNGRVVDGLWANTLGHYLSMLDSSNFNAVRLPLAFNTIMENTIPNNSMLSAEPELQGLPTLQLLDAVIAACAMHRKLVVLDLHRLDSSVWPDPKGLWNATPFVNGSDAGLPKGYCSMCSYGPPMGYGVPIPCTDILNEPHGGTWSSGDLATDWDVAATAIGDAILAECPRWLVFVEGIGQAGRKVPEYFWGENLEAARHSQITLAVPDKLVYSPHIYGPGLVEYMHYFMDEHFADDMPHVWNTHFGFLFGGKAGVVIGEWGGPLKTEADRQWQRAVVDYLIRHDHVSSFYWCLNPNAGDTGGLLEDDWTTPRQDKLDLLKPLSSSDIGVVLRGSPPIACAGFRDDDAEHVVFRCESQRSGRNGVLADCLPLPQRCNGVPECADGSDERDCIFVPCVTLRGQDPHRECRLPFSYGGQVHHACTLADAGLNGEAWCPTDLDEFGAFLSYMKAGVCGPGCPQADAQEHLMNDCNHGESPANCAPPPSQPPARRISSAAKAFLNLPRLKPGAALWLASIFLCGLGLLLCLALLGLKGWALWRPRGTRRGAATRSRRTSNRASAFASDDQLLLQSAVHAETERLRCDKASSEEVHAAFGGAPRWTGNAATGQCWSDYVYEDECQEPAWWYLDEQRAQKGPFTPAEMASLLEHDHLPQGDLTFVWCDHLTDWQQAVAVKSQIIAGQTSAVNNFFSEQSVPAIHAPRLM